MAEKRSEDRRKLARRTVAVKAGADGKSLKLPGQPLSKQAKQVETEGNTMSKSMQISHDSRYAEIEHYYEVGSSRLDRIVGSDGSPNKLYPEQWKFPEPIGHRASQARHDLPNKGHMDPNIVGPPVEEPETLDLAHDFEVMATREAMANHAGQRASKFAGRVNWEESFRQKCKNLMIDFNLTSDPSCRLHHLDRMHKWFTVEGKKQTRKEKPAPNFLTFEKHTEPCPGSARNFGPPSSVTTCNLACTLQMQNRCPRIVPHLGEQPPPPPQPGYK